MEWEFAGCPARLGQITLTGPVTGQPWTYTPYGVWAPAEDVYALSELTIETFCQFRQCMIEIKPVLILRPSAVDMERKPNGTN